MTARWLLLLVGTATAAFAFGPAVSADGNVDWNITADALAPLDSPPGWTPDTLLTEPDNQESRDPSAAFDARGRLHVAWKDNLRLQGHDEIHYLDKDSSGWGSVHYISNLDTAHNSPALAVDRSGNVHVFFLRWSGQPYGLDLGYRRRDAATGEWGDEERLTDQDSLTFTSKPYAACIGDTVFVFWRITNVSPALFGYVYNNGSGWSDYRVVSTGEERYRNIIALGASRDGWLHLVWEDDRIDTTQLWHRYHNGDSWSTPCRVTYTGYSSVHPGIGFDSSGNLHLAYASGNNPDQRLQYRIWNRAARTWGPATTWYSWNGAPEPRIGINLATGERHLTYIGHDHVNYGQYYRRFDPDSGLWTDSTRLTFNGAITGPAQPLLDADGCVHLVFWTAGYGSQEELIYKTNRLPVAIEEMGSAVRRTPAATIIRGMLFLPPSLSPSISSSLLDASGRRVLDLHPGSNNVSHLSPGVYFVRSFSPNGDGIAPAQGLRRIILAR